jgi:hypothetical protein
VTCCHAEELRFGCRNSCGRNLHQLRTNQQAGSIASLIISRRSERGALSGAHLFGKREGKISNIRHT